MFGKTSTVVFDPGLGETTEKQTDYVNVDKLIKSTKISACAVWIGTDANAKNYHIQNINKGGFK